MSCPMAPDRDRDADPAPDAAPGCIRAAAAARLLHASEVVVRPGADAGASLADDDAPAPGDVYAIRSGALARALARVGAPARPLLHLTFLAADGSAVEATTFGDGAASVALLRGALAESRELTLVAVAPAPPGSRPIARPLTGFGRGTRILMADGAARPVEALRPGDRVLTRDDGAVRVLRATATPLRAVGPQAPVVIGPRRLGNPASLRLSGDQRLLLPFGPDRARAPARLTAAADLAAAEARDAPPGAARSSHPEPGALSVEGGWWVAHDLVLERRALVFAECVPVECLPPADASAAPATADLVATWDADAAADADAAGLAPPSPAVRRPEAAPALLSHLLASPAAA